MKWHTIRWRFTYYTNKTPKTHQAMELGGGGGRRYLTRCGYNCYEGQDFELVADDTPITCKRCLRAIMSRNVSVS